MKRFLIFILPMLMLASCHTNKQAQTLPPAPVILNNSDSVRVETIVKTEYIPVMVEAQVPQQSVCNIVFEADTSHIETDVAESNAWIRPDGTLFHNLVNKDVKLAATTHVPQTTTENNISKEKVKEITVPYPVNVYVEKDLSKWQQFRLYAFWYLVGAIAIAVGWIFRKPLISFSAKG